MKNTVITAVTIVLLIIATACDSGSNLEPASKEIEVPKTAKGPTPSGGNGTLKVLVNHMDSSFKIINAAKQTVTTKKASDCPDVSAYRTCQFSLPAGFYTVEFEDVERFKTPADADVQLAAKGATVKVDYTVPGNNMGALKVLVNHMDSSFKIINAAKQTVTTKKAGDCPDVDSYRTCQLSLPTGFYTVEFEDVTKFKTPADVDVQLAAKGATVKSTYTPE